MKTKRDTAATVRAIIRWTAGIGVAVTIPTTACFFFPVLTNLPALSLTVCFSAFIGLNIALPPLDPEDDWVPIHSKTNEESGKEISIQREKVKVASSDASEKIQPFPNIEILPVHTRRATGTSSKTWHMAHPEFLKVRDEAHEITLSKSPHRQSRVIEFPADKKG